ncbi:hypothetical protein [Thalassospira sp.]|uniref:hypothetical protein n=1 Tax=Thalassospira sp. TaxID=1912094 RepID=UPI003AA9C0B9
MPAVIHVKLSGEGDFGPVDLECAIPPARLPVVMAALFGQAAPAAMINSPVVTMMPPGVPGVPGGVPSPGKHAASTPVQEAIQPSQKAQASNGGADEPVDGGGFSSLGYGDGVAPSGAMDPGMFISAFVGSFGDLVARLQPRGFAETILLAAIWLQYREGRGFVTRGDIRRLLRRQDRLRMPRNFSRDFQAAVMRGYLEEREEGDAYAVTTDGFQWFYQECIK